MPLRQCRCGRAVPKIPCDECKGIKRRMNERNRKRSEGNFHSTSAWTKLSLEHRSRHPLCQRCEGAGITEAATEVHHIRPVATHPQLKLNPNNLISLCCKCHHAVHRGEELFRKRPK